MSPHRDTATVPHGPAAVPPPPTLWRRPIITLEDRTMRSLQDNLWLIVGGVAALGGVGLGLGDSLSRLLAGLLPLPWGRLGAALGVFAVFAVLHFRYRLIRQLQRHRADLERSAAASRLILSAAADGRRWLRVVQENLELVAEGAQAERERHLYLSGARAHADKLEQAFERIEGNQREHDRSAGLGG